ncbi:MAG: DUF1223 domain-containing protein [Candidatus Acidiferrales bacterium]
MLRVRFVLTGLASILLLGALLLPRLKAAGGPTHSANDSTQRTPVLVELFTSEGCSDCPPADALLEKLDRSQPVSGAELIVLSEHVDYWNDIGWKDPFSSREYSERQGAYAGQFGLGSVYTPQMVVDGRIQLVGSDERGAIQAIENATKAEKIPVNLSSIHFEGEKILLHIETGPSPSSIPDRFANVLLAIADESDQSNVSRGENAGRTLKHVAVLRDLVRVGALDRSGKFSQDVAVNLNHGNKGNFRIVAIVQEPTAGRVLGAGSARLSN